MPDFRPSALAMKAEENDTMKAALKTAEGTFTVERIESPHLPAGNWVKARVRVAGICGTDLRHWKKHEPELECHVMGHELSGEVIEVGPAVTRVKPGDRVVIETVMGDGECPWCLVQKYNVCPHLYEVRTKSVSAPTPSTSLGLRRSSTACPTT